MVVYLPTGTYLMFIPTQGDIPVNDHTGMHNKVVEF